MVSGVSTLSTPGAASPPAVSIERTLPDGDRAFDQHGIGEPFELLLDRVFRGAGDLGRTVDARQPAADCLGVPSEASPCLCCERSCRFSQS